jgi:effector-binding domain-containing protein
VEIHDVVIKKTQPMRIAEALADGLTHRDLGPAWERLLPEVMSYLDTVSANHGISAGTYEYQGSAEDYTITLHAGFDVGDQNVRDSERVRVIDLPVVDVASLVYHGPMNGIPSAWEALVAWVEDNGYRLVGESRELYHEHDEENHVRHVTELQVAIGR